LNRPGGKFAASIAVNIATTFARSDGNDFGGNLVVKYRF